MSLKCTGNEAFFTFTFAIFFPLVFENEGCSPILLFLGWCEQERRQQLDIWLTCFLFFFGCCFLHRRRKTAVSFNLVGAAYTLDIKPHYLMKAFLTGCWRTWPLSRSIAGSCHPACVGGTRLPLSCPEPWPSWTCSRPRSWRCHCGNRSQPGCPSNTGGEKKGPMLNNFKGKGNRVWWNSHAEKKQWGEEKSASSYQNHPENWTSQCCRLSQLIIAEPRVTADCVMGTGLEGVHGGLRTTTPEGRAVWDSLSVSLRYF